MTDPILRLYETEQQARDAAARLRDRGLPKEMIFLVTPESEGDPASADTVSRAVAAGFVRQGWVANCADGVRRGHTLLAIRAPFGRGVLASFIMGGLDPIDSALEHREPLSGWDEAAPLSSGFRMPVLWRGQAAPLSRLLGQSTLSRGRTFQNRYTELTSPDATFSSRLGLRLLNRNQAPRASLSGTTAWTASLGLPLLSPNPAPLSSRLGLHMKTGPLPPYHPAPFSERLGLPMLSRGRTFLSRLFGELVSPHFALFGRASLSRNTSPLSSLLGMPLLAQDPGPFSARLGRPLLSDHPQLSSSRLGLPLLSRNPAPLSSLFHLRLLSRFQ